MSTPRRSGLTRKRQLRQCRHSSVPRAARAGLRAGLPVSFRRVSPHSTAPYPANGQTPPHMQQPVQVYPARQGPQRIHYPSGRGGRDQRGTDGSVDVDPVRAYSRGDLLRGGGPAPRAGPAAGGPAAGTGLDRRGVGSRATQADRPRMGRRGRRAHQHRPGSACGRGGCHRPRRGAARAHLGPERSAEVAKVLTPGRASMRPRSPVPQPYRRPRPRRHELSPATTASRISGSCHRHNAPVPLTGLAVTSCRLTGAAAGRRVP